MSIRPKAGRAAASATACLFVIAALALPTPVHPVALEAVEDEAGLAWLGCWELWADREDDSQGSPDDRQRVCVAPGDEPRSLDLTARTDDDVVATQTLITDGSRQSTTDSGCIGWTRALFSEDRRRLYLQSETICEGGGQRHLSGASMMLSANHWIDIRVLRVDGEREIAIQDYRPVGADAVTLPGALPAAPHAARLAAAAPLSADDVIEALALVDPAVVEAMLLESEARFPIDSRLLLRLAEARVPDEIIDLMVALSFPEYFAIEGDTAIRQPAVYYGSFWSPWYPYYGWGYGYYYHHPHPPVDGHPGKDHGGKVISGRGYVGVRPTEMPTGGFADAVQRAANSGAGGGFSGAGGSGVGGGSFGTSGGGASGSVSSSGYQGGNSTSTRPAVPKQK
jgi:uncharacterized membrane protein YgcG